MGLFKKLLGYKDVKVTGNMHVNTLQKSFEESFGTKIRIYKNKSGKGRFAGAKDTLSSISDQKVESFDIKKNYTVKQVEDFFKESAGIGVQVATPDDSALADDNMKLKDVAS